jgi:hypothetical protein
MNFKDLQEMILKRIDFKLSPLLSAELHSLQFEGKPWSLTSVNRMAQELHAGCGSRFLALITNNLYGDFLDSTNLPGPNDPAGRWIRKKLKESGWERPLNNFKDLCEAAELLGVGIDYLFAFLSQENPKELEKQAFNLLSDPTKVAA